MTQKFKMSMLSRDMSISPKTLDDKENTFECIFTKGVGVMRHLPYSDETYEELLSMEPGAIRMQRIQSGSAPFLYRHYQDDVLGVVVSASIENGMGKAKIKYSKRDDAKGYVTDIKDGILRSVSCGYDVHKYSDISEVDEKGRVKKRRLLAVDWEPKEISLVPMPAEFEAKIRSIENESMKYHEVEIENFLEVNKVADEPKNQTRAQEPGTTPVIPPVPTTTLSQEDLQMAKTEGAEAERKRQSEIANACRKAKMPDEFREKLLASNATADQARAQIIDAWQEVGKQYQVSNHPEVCGQDATVTRREAIQNAILHRGNPGIYKLTDAGKAYRTMTLIELMRDSLEVRGEKTRGMGKDEIVTRGLQSSSDFPQLLANVATKTLLDGYQQFPQTFLPFVIWIAAPDFKNMSAVRIGEAPTLSLIPESGELKQGKVLENGETWAIKSYGRKVGLTRKAIINDDLGAFTQIPFQFGVQANMLESDLFWGIITSNPNMSDSKALFHADHGNLAGSGAAISITTLSAGRKAFMQQKGLDGTTPLNIPPMCIVCPVSLLTVAEQYSAQVVPMNAAEPDKYNPFGRVLQPPVAESRLDLTSETNWYLFGDGRFCPIIAMGTLEGVRGPKLNTVTLAGFDGIQIEAIYDIGAKALDYRGVYKNPH